MIGWAKKMEEPEEEPDEKLFDLHREQFPGEDRLLFLYDSEENASVFLTENTGIRKQSGYYIYYEKNEQMQSYMVKENEGQSVEAESKNQDGAIQNFRRRIAKNNRTHRTWSRSRKAKLRRWCVFIWCKYV
ncbi:LysM domain protein, partial [human gut metagenome]